MPSNVERVQEMWNGRFASSEAVNVFELLADQEVLDANRRTLAPDATVEFATPDGGFIGGMAGPFAGPDGMLAAWHEWVKPWTSYSIRVDEWSEPRPGVVLMLGEASGRLAGSNLELDSPIGAVCTVRDGQIVHMQHFLDQDQAREAASTG
jgi:hypothetical protein